MRRTAPSLLAVVALGALALLPSSASAALPTFGFSHVGLGGSDAGGERLEQVAAAAEDLGSSGGVQTRVMRLELGWADVQPGDDPNPPFDWQRSDRIYASLRDHGIKPLWIVTRAPNWARDPSDQCRPAPAGQCPPGVGHLGDWRTFVNSVVLRYPESAGIEVWNEPNLRKFWGTSINPARYVDVLRSAHTGVQEAAAQLRPSMPEGWDFSVLLGGPADPESGGVWGELSARDWLKAVYDAEGGERHFDALSVHIYPTQTVPPDMATPTLPETMQGYVEIRDAHGDAARPIWLTEIGYHTAGDDQNFGEHTDPRQQGEFLRCAYGLLVDNPDNVAGFLVNDIADQSERAIEQEGSFGLLAHDLSHKAPPPNDGYSILQSYFAGSPSPVTTCG